MFMTSYQSMLQIVVVHCGSNNIKRNSPQSIANAIGNIIRCIEGRLPNAKIFVSEILSCEGPAIILQVAETNVAIQVCL